MSQPDILDQIDAALTSNIGSQVAVRAPSAVEPVSGRALVPLEPASREPDRVVGYVVTDAPERRRTPAVVMGVLTVLGAACLILGCLVQVGWRSRYIVVPLAVGAGLFVLAKAVAIVLVGVVVACAG